jgi:sulfonate transport system permease protein
MTDALLPPVATGIARRRRGLILPVTLLLLWEGSSQLGLIDPKLLPSLGAVAVRAWTELVDGRLIGDITASLTRDLAGFAIGSAAGVPVGLALGLSRTVDRVLGPTFNAVKQIAIFAWIPLLSVWFGVGEEAKIAFIALAAFIPVVTNTWAGARSVPRELAEVARILTFSRRQFLFKVSIPAALPSIFIGLHLGLIYSWLATVGAEYFMTIGPGIGGLMTEGREHFLMDLVMLGVVLLGVIGLGLNHLATIVEARALRWQRR